MGNGPIAFSPSGSVNGRFEQIMKMGISLTPVKFAKAMAQAVTGIECSEVLNHAEIWY